MAEKPILNKVSAQTENIAFQVNKALDTLAEECTKKINEDGSTPFKGDVDLNGYRIKNIKDAINLSDVPSYKQLLTAQIDNLDSIDYKAANIKGLLAIDTTKLSGNELCIVYGYHESGDGGSGFFYWDSTEDKANHNGGTIIDPDIIFPDDWSNTTQQQVWYTAGSGTGCWKRIYDGDIIKIKWFGVVGDNVTSDYEALKAAIKTASDLNKSLLINSPVDLDGNTLDCKGVNLFWKSEGNVVSNGQISNTELYPSDIFKCFNTNVTFDRYTVSILESDPIIFGAVGNGVADDYISLQNTFNLTSRRIVLTKQYKTTKSIDIGIFSIDSNTNDVLGFAYAKSLEIIGKNDRFTYDIIYDGDIQTGDSTTVITDSVGDYTYVTNDKPVISIVAGSQVKFDGVYIKGNNKAYTGIHLQGNLKHFSFKNSNIEGVIIGIRLGTSWDYVRNIQYYGRGESPYYKANIQDISLSGGWQFDFIDISNSNIYAGTVGVSCESSQILNGKIEQCQINTDSLGDGTPISMIGGTIHINNCTLAGKAFSSIKFITNSNKLTLNNIHFEGNFTYNLITATNNVSLDFIKASHCDYLKTYIYGGLSLFSIDNCKNTAIEIADIDRVNPLYLDINNTEIVDPYIVAPTSNYTDKIILNTNNIQSDITDFIKINNVGGNNSVGTLYFIDDKDKFTASIRTHNIYYNKTNDVFKEYNNNIINVNTKFTIANNNTTTALSFNKTVNYLYQAVLYIFYHTGISVHSYIGYEKIAFSVVLNSNGVLSLSAIDVLESKTNTVGSITTPDYTYNLVEDGSKIRFDITQTNNVGANLTTNITGHVCSNILNYVSIS